MKRYDCYYTNDFGNDYPAFSKATDEGDWVSFEDAQAEIATLESVNEKWCNTISRLRDELTAACLERDELKRTMRLIEVQEQGCGGNLRPEEIYRAMQKLAREALS